MRRERVMHSRDVPVRRIRVVDPVQGRGLMRPSPHLSSGTLSKTETIREREFIDAGSRDAIRTRDRLARDRGVRASRTRS